MRFLRASKLEIATDGQPVTGFYPSDMNELAPDYLVSAVQAFAAPLALGPTIEVDPLGNLTEKELRAHDKEKEMLRQSMLAAWEATGVRGVGI